MNIFCRVLFCLSLGWLLGGCSMVRTSLMASSDINPDVNGQASPITVKLYQLQDNDLFNQANFFGLFDTPEATLESELIRSRTVVISPGDTQDIWMTLDPATQYIGVVAGYRLLDKTVWRQVYGIDKNKNHYLGVDLTIQLTNQGLLINEIAS